MNRRSRSTLIALLCVPLWLAACSNDGSSAGGADAPRTQPTIPPADESPITPPVAPPGDSPGESPDIDADAERTARATALLAPRAALPLAGTRWQAEAVVTRFGKAALRSGLAYTLGFAPGTADAGGYDGCNAHERSYALAGEFLTISEIGNNDQAYCEFTEDEAEDQRTVGGLIAATQTFGIRGDRLFLDDGNGSTLVLRGQAPDTLDPAIDEGIDPEFEPGEPVPFVVLDSNAGTNLGADEVSVPERFVTTLDTTSFESLWRNAHSNDPAVPPPAFDFDIGSVVAVFSPLRPSLGYSIRVDSIVADGARARVRVVTTVPGPDCATADALSVPYAFVAVPSVLAEPMFEETIVEAEGCA